MGLKFRALDVAEYRVLHIGTHAELGILYEIAQNDDAAASEYTAAVGLDPRAYIVYTKLQCWFS